MAMETLDLLNMYIFPFRGNWFRVGAQVDVDFINSCSAGNSQIYGFFLVTKWTGGLSVNPSTTWIQDGYSSFSTPFNLQQANQPQATGN